MGYIRVGDLGEQKRNFDSSHRPQLWEHSKEEVGLPEPGDSQERSYRIHIWTSQEAWLLLLRLVLEALKEDGDCSKLLLLGQSSQEQQEPGRKSSSPLAAFHSPSRSSRWQSLTGQTAMTQTSLTCDPQSSFKLSLGFLLFYQYLKKLSYN